MVESKDRLTLMEVSRELGRSLEQVRRYVREGRLPAKKLGMQWFVSRRDLEAFKSNGGRVDVEDVLAKAKANRVRIQSRVGLVDVVEMLEESRWSHP
jgi:excisionase family DNA binding protein